MLTPWKRVTPTSGWFPAFLHYILRVFETGQRLSSLLNGSFGQLGNRDIERLQVQGCLAPKIIFKGNSLAVFFKGDSLAVFRIYHKLGITKTTRQPPQLTPEVCT